MTTNSFINALRRFQAIRGQCSTIVCDNGTNIVGTENELQRLEDAIDMNTVENRFAFSHIKWRKIPVLASHYGGVYERKLEVLGASWKECCMT